MMLRSMLIAAASAAIVSAAAPAQAADLGHKGSPYDDPRYSEMYGHTPPPRYAHPIPAAPVYPPYAQPPFVPPHYAQPQYAPVPAAPPAYRHDGRYAGDCLPRHVIRDQLASRGWHELHDAQVMGNVVHIRARRPNGRLFDLTLDRCSGEVIHAQVIDNRSAYAPPPPDWRYPEGRRY